MSPSAPPPVWLFRLGHAFQALPSRSAVTVLALASGVLAGVVGLISMTLPIETDGGAALLTALLPAVLATALVCGFIGWAAHRLLCDLTQARNALLAVTTHDPTTQALSERHFMQRARQVIDQAGPGARELCVVLVRLEQHDALADRHGRGFVDDVLRSISGACLRQLRAHDLFARHGDNEFVGLLQASHPNLADIALSRLRRAIDVLQHLDHDGATVPVTVTLGVSQIDYDTTSLEQALARIAQRDGAGMSASGDAGNNRLRSDTATA